MDHIDLAISCGQGGAVFIQKNIEYGDSVEDTGVLGAVVELIGLAGRLRTLVLQHPDLSQSDEQHCTAVHNALLDVHNYAAIGMYMLRKGNWKGESQ